MEFKKLTAPSLKELFITEIQNMILSGKLEIGEQLPPERELAESMHVSRAVVNSGIATLEKKGFLDVRPRIGNFVADYRKNGTLETLVAIMHYNGGILRDNEVKSILEVRVIILSLAAKLAIEQASDEEIATLAPYLEQLKNCTDPQETAELMFAFSHDLSFISGNTLLPLLCASFKDLVISLWYRYAKKYGCERLYESAHHIYDYIIAKDAKGACDFIEKSSQESIDGDYNIYTNAN